MKNKIEVGDLVGHRDTMLRRGIVIELKHQQDVRYAEGRWDAWVLWVTGGVERFSIYNAKYLISKGTCLVMLAKGSNK